MLPGEVESMYRPLGGRNLLIMSGAAGAIDVANGTSGSLFVDIVLKIFEFAIILQFALVVGLFVIAIVFRSRLRYRDRHDNDASSRGLQSER